MMMGQMMEQPLLLSSLLTHAERYHGDTEVVSRTLEGGFHRYGYADAARRARRMANALARLGVTQSERVTKLAGHGYGSFELYYTLFDSSYVLPTANSRPVPRHTSRTHK